MNEADRFKEKKESEARAEARKRDLKSRRPPDYTTYDLTLKMVDEPGLPPPTVHTNLVAAKETPSPVRSADDLIDEEEKDDSVAAPDATMEETERILRDLVSLSGNDGALAGPTR